MSESEQVKCPYCESPPGRPCMTNTGKTRSPHQERLNEVHKIRQAKQFRPQKPLESCTPEELRSENKRLRRVLAFIPYGVLDTAINRSGV